MFTLALATLFTVTTVAFAGTSASSEKKGFDSSMAVDGLLQTAWMEDVVGNGENQSFTLNLSQSTEIKVISIWPGNLSNGSRSYKQYARPKVIRVLVDGNQVGNPIRLLDKPQRLDVDHKGQGKKIEIVIDEVFEGMVYSDLAIAEVAVNFPDNSQGERVVKWAESKDGTRVQDKYVETLNIAYDKCKTAEFGDRDSFELLGVAAADGSPHFQSKVQGLVPDGFRIQALPSDETAQKALRKLKDPNAIPYLELASLRTSGKEKALIQSDVEYLEAYGELLGGANRNVKFWGEEGWATGEVRSLGEPLPIEVNRVGELYLADIGNNRIQMFNEEGRVTRTWGGAEANITNEWFVKGRPWYVSGATPGRKPGQFVNPVDIVFLPEKDADGFATLDANGRVQLFDIEGRSLISWTANPTYAPEPKLGGTAYLVYLPQKDYICTILQDEGICFNREAEEMNRWPIKDGTPNAVEVVKNDVILMAFGDTIVSYAFDGFRNRIVIDEKILGQGFESLDMTVDETGKLWVITDRGNVYKFKKPGKLEYSLLAIERTIKNPRIAVLEDILYISTDDRIEVIDIRQRKLDLEEKAE